jgi:DNA-binding GntR family transcriptional regulator
VPTNGLASHEEVPGGSLPHLQRENITTRIYRELRTRIMAGQFKPGETLTLRAIAESMGVSQTPAREALLQLSSERVLSFSPGRSVRVPRLTRSELEELGLIRTALECLAASHVAKHSMPALANELESIHAQLMPLKRAGDITGLLDRNLHFHFALYRAAELPTLLAVIEGLWARTGPYIRFLYRPPFSDLPSGHPHEDIIEGLREKNANRVEAALRREIESHWEILVRHAVDSDVLEE